MPNTREWYFVRKLGPIEARQHRAPLEIQRLDDSGKALESGYVAPEASRLVLCGQEVPTDVIRAASGRRPGEGVYVGRDGQPERPN